MLPLLSLVKTTTNNTKTGEIKGSYSFTGAVVVAAATVVVATIDVVGAVVFAAAADADTAVVVIADIFVVVAVLVIAAVVVAVIFVIAVFVTAAASVTRTTAISCWYSYNSRFCRLVHKRMSSPFSRVYFILSISPKYENHVLIVLS